MVANAKSSLLKSSYHITSLYKNSWVVLQSFFAIDLPKDGGNHHIQHIFHGTQILLGVRISPRALWNIPLFFAEENKILQHWDLYSCGVPKWSTTCNSTKNSFDVIMIRDALQHIAISKAGLPQQPVAGLLRVQTRGLIVIFSLSIFQLKRCPRFIHWKRLNQSYWFYNRDVLPSGNLT